MDYQKELILFLEHFAPNQSQDVRDAVELDASFHVINVPKLLAVKGLSENYVFRLKDSWNAWKAAKAQAVPAWISVKDNLPPENILVLGMSQTPHNIFNIYNVMALDEFEEADVTHWMPLPDAPQEPAND